MEAPLEPPEISSSSSSSCLPLLKKEEAVKAELVVKAEDVGIRMVEDPFDEAGIEMVEDPFLTTDEEEEEAQGRPFLIEEKRRKKVSRSSRTSIGTHTWQAVEQPSADDF